LKYLPHGLSFAILSYFISLTPSVQPTSYSVHAYANRIFHMFFISYPTYHGTMERARHRARSVVFRITYTYEPRRRTSSVTHIRV
jgi:hypothetical protein